MKNKELDKVLIKIVEEIGKCSEEDSYKRATLERLYNNTFEKLMNKKN